MKNQQIETILASWINTGHEFKPGSKLLKHPEYIYRKSGEWKGWNSFLNQSEGSVSFESNKQQDQLEDQVWQLYMSRFHS
jgi:hypothetical protein